MEKRVAIFIFFLFVFNALSVFFIPIVHSGAVPSPTISFTEPTDVYIETNISHLVVNVSVTNGSNPVSTFIDWNKSLVAYYNFEEVGASTISDNSTHSYTGTYTGGIGDYDVIPSPRGFGMHFNGTSDYINCGLAGSEHYTEMTIEAWIMMSSTTPSGWRTALHRNDGTTVGSSVFFIGLESGTHNIVATIGAGSTGPTYTSGRTGVPAVPGVWYHVVNSWDGTTARVYINGTEMVSYALTSTNFVSKPGAVTMLGTSYSASGYSFHGGVDEVRIWNRSLSHDEINASHNSTVKNYLNRNFTDLENGNRSYYAHAINDGGGEATTGTQYVNVTLPYVDDWKPFSRVDNITTYEQNSAPITITATANDTGEGVKNVTLYYRHSIDNLTWAGGESNWWNTDWDYRKLITIDSSQITDTLTNFPILVHTDGDTSLLDNALANGSDITFIDWDDNTTQFNHEIESYYTGTLNAWVNITTLYHNKDKKLWMYYGNTSSLPQENVFGTWDGDFSQVLHLNETDIDNGIGDIKDSSNRFINATTKNMQTDEYKNNGQRRRCRELLSRKGR
ncbi:MAG: hypothetical protein B7C24_14835 [Bacteroidetes bacterium 4572_77]|nr:MAG: hypothetical protein B7C24_14835 [Bacteroidetes bacterium 4572_77]